MVRRTESVETCTGRDGLALPREIEEGFLIHIPAEECRRQRKILEDAPQADGTLCANIGNASSLGEVWGKFCMAGLWVLLGIDWRIRKVNRNLCLIEHIQEDKTYLFNKERPIRA